MPATQASAPTRNERRRARTRAALLDAARTLFAERGPDATSIAEIAEAADTAVGTVYNYFDDKEALLVALIEESLADELQRLRRRQAQVDDPAEAISVAHRHLIALVEDDPEWAWLIVRLDGSHRVINTAMGVAAMRDLQAGIKAGRLTAGDPRVAVQASGGALVAVIRARLLGELGNDAAIAHAEGVLRSFGVAPAEAAEIARRPLPSLGEQEMSAGGRR
ncbi:MAG TPA: helix-turn-helix domain-containing protein [Solirubrobacteraceae bacterium]|nr:helix-turn-helix domain-containing protein [Solirubrobacteraceae bacterium]